jgi:hypothetical protein
MPLRPCAVGGPSRCCVWAVALLLLQPTRSVAQDTVRVRADGAPSWGPSVRLVQFFALGAVNGPPEYAFGKIEWIAVDPSGAFYTYDSKDIQIRHYSSNGRFLNLIGRKGSGPGEYRDVAGMAVTPDVLLLVYDARTRRMTFFRPDGKVHHAFEVSRNAYTGSGELTDNAGRIYLRAASPGAPMEGPQSHPQLLRFRDRQLLDSLPLPPPDRVIPGAFGVLTTDGMRGEFFDKGILRPYSGGGVVSARSGAYRFVIDTGGPSVTVIERSAKSVPFTSGERAEWTAIAQSFARSRHLGNGLPIPHAKPFLRDLRSDNLGRIWVEVSVAAEQRTNVPPSRPGGAARLTWRERTTYDVFTPSGSYLGRVVLPAESVLKAIHDDRLWLRSTGTAGEDRIAVFRIQP